MTHELLENVSESMPRDLKESKINIIDPSLLLYMSEEQNKMRKDLSRLTFLSVVSTFLFLFCCVFTYLFGK